MSSPTYFSTPSSTFSLHLPSSSSTLSPSATFTSKNINNSSVSSNSSASSSSISHPHHHHYHHDHTHDIQPSVSSSSSSLSPCPLPSCGFLRRSFWNPHCCCLFSSLPDELLLFNIFTFLPSDTLCLLHSICNRWKWLAGDRMLWREIDFSHSKTLAKKINDKGLVSMMKRGGKGIEILKLCHCQQISTQFFLSSSIYSSSLSSLRDIHLCHLRQVDDTFIKTLATRSTQLRKISLFGCVNVTDRGVKAMLTLLPSLEEVNLRGVTQLSNSAFVGDNNNNEIAQSTDISTSPPPRSILSPFLHTFNLHGCSKLSRPALLSLSSQSPLLTSLNLHGINVDDNIIHHIPSHSPLLNTLHLSSSNPFGGSPLLTDASLLSLSSLSSLSVLNLQGASNVTDQGLLHLSSIFPQLVKLNIGGLHNITDHGILSLVKRIGDDVCQMTHLSLFQCVNIGDASLLSFLSHLPLLEELDCHSMTSISDYVVHTLMNSKGFHRSTSPHSGAHFPSSPSRSPSSSFSSSLSSSSTLLSSSLSASSSLSSLSLSVSSSSSSSLTPLDDDSNLSPTSPFLSFPPSPSPSPTPASLPPLPHLLSFDIGSCRKISPSAVESFMAARSNVKVTYYTNGYQKK